MKSRDFPNMLYIKENWKMKPRHLYIFEARSGKGQSRCHHFYWASKVKCTPDILPKKCLKFFNQLRSCARRTRSTPLPNGFPTNHEVCWVGQWFHKHLDRGQLTRWPADYGHEVDTTAEGCLSRAVAEWSKAPVCRTEDRGFNSHRDSLISNFWFYHWMETVLAWWLPSEFVPPRVGRVVKILWNCCTNVLL